MTLNVSSQLPRPLFENCDNIRASRYFTLHMLTCARCKFSPCFSQHSEACLSIFPHPRNFERRLQTRLRRRGPSGVPASGRICTLCVRNATGFSGFTHLSESYSNRHLNCIYTRTLCVGFDKEVTANKRPLNRLGH